MKKLTAVLAAVALAALPVSAYAAGLTTTASNTTNAAASTAAGASLTSKSSFSDVMGSLSTPTTDTTGFSSIKATSNVSIVKVSTLSGWVASGMKLSAANTANMAKLDAQVAANATLTAKLKAAGYKPSDVAAVSTDAKGDVTLFVAS